MNIKRQIERSSKRIYLALKVVSSMVFLFVFGLGIFGVHNVEAATYYVDSSALNDDGDGSFDNPKKYINSGCLLLAQSDTLIIRDGIYNTENDFIENVPSGIAGAPTAIRADNDFGVILSPPHVEYHPPIHFRNKSYITVRGIVVIQNDTNDFGVSVGGESDRSCDNIKFLKIGSNHGLYAGFSSDILFEDCFAWGGHNYHMQSYRSYRITWRRCVVRYDHILNENNEPAYANNVPQASFVAYNTEDAVFENCIAVDGQTYSNVVPAGYQITANNYTPLDSTRAKFLGSIAINQKSSPNASPVAVNGFYIDVSQAATNALFKDCVSMGSSGYGFALNNSDNALMTNVTAIDNSSGLIVTSSSSGVILKDSLMLLNRGYGVYSGNSDYFSFYDNSLGIYHGGTHTNFITTDPELLYPVRIEEGSAIYETGSEGNNRGASIIYRYEDGELTNTLLWPFPNEDIIKEKFKAYNRDGVNGARGFCADGTGLYGGRITLTSYIWEYLGNPCPVDICNYYDVNRDGEVNVQDVQAVANVILGTASNDNADATGDGSVNVQDIQGIVNVILH